jgi:hypothetical protein
MTAERRGEALDRRLSAITRLTAELVATATLVVETGGPGFNDITREVARASSRRPGPRTAPCSCSCAIPRHRW